MNFGPAGQRVAAHWTPRCWRSCTARSKILAPGHIPLAGAVDSQKHVLSQVFGQMATAGQVLQDGDQPILIANHQLIESGRIVVAHRQHQPHVGILQLVAPGR